MIDGDGNAVPYRPITDSPIYQYCHGSSQNVFSLRRNSILEVQMKNAVRNLAYNLWEQAGRPDGRDQEFWLEAERLLMKPIPETKGKLAPRDAKPKEVKKARKGDGTATDKTSVATPAESAVAPAPATAKARKTSPSKTAAR